VSRRSCAVAGSKLLTRRDAFEFSDAHLHGSNGIGTAAYRSIAETVWDSYGMMPVVRIYSIAAVDAHAKPMWHHKSVIGLFQIVLRLLADLIALIVFAFRQRRATAAEILVLRRQIALYQERGIKPRRIDAVTRISLALLSRLFTGETLWSWCVPRQ
jgi:hypothetical protein